MDLRTTCVKKTGRLPAGPSKDTNKRKLPLVTPKFLCQRRAAVIRLDLYVAIAAMKKENPVLATGSSLHVKYEKTYACTTVLNNYT